MGKVDGMGDALAQWEAQAFQQSNGNLVGISLTTNKGQGSPPETRTGRHVCTVVQNAYIQRMAQRLQRVANKMKQQPVAQAQVPATPPSLRALC